MNRPTARPTPEELPGGTFALPGAAGEELPGGTFTSPGLRRQELPGGVLAFAGAARQEPPGGTFALPGLGRRELPVGDFALPGAAGEELPGGTFTSPGLRRQELPGGALAFAGAARQEPPGGTFAFPGAARQELPGGTLAFPGPGCEEPPGWALACPDPARRQSPGAARAFPGPAPALAAVLFDRDGTLVEDVPYNGDPGLVRPMPGAREALALLRAEGVATGVVSNQSGIGRGFLTDSDVRRVNDRADTLLGGLGTWVYCPHRPDAGCDCRKPRPGLVVEAARRLGVTPRDCVVIGDIGADVRAAHAAGARGVLVPNAATLPEEVRRAPATAPDLLTAVRALLAAPAATGGDRS